MKGIRTLYNAFRLLLILAGSALYHLFHRSSKAAVFPTKADPAAASDQVPNHYVVKYDDDVRLVAQQTTSRLEGSVTVYDGIVGSSKSVDRYGSTEDQEVTDRFADTRMVNTPHQRRWIDLRDFDWADFIDSFDELKILDNPTNKYVMGAVAAHNRRKDRIIHEAAFGTARNFDNTLVALPAAQIIVNGNTDISMAKIRTAIELLNAAEAASPEEGGERTFVFTSRQLTTLMADTTLTSSDYNTLQALQNYKVDFFMGMNWKRVESLAKTAAGIRSCGIYGKDYVALGMGQNIKNKVSERADKRHAIQCYSSMSLGAVRVEDAGVILIECKEA